MRDVRMNLLIFWNLLIASTALQHDCSKSEHEHCVKIAEPLIKEIRLIFPDNMNDIDLVCRTWNNLVDCLKKYTERCFTDQQRHQFNKAIENPIQSVHQMCSQPNYQKEYLQYAPCMKNTLVDNGRCAPQYSFLVDQVDQGDIISKSTLCCSHDRFKQCVLHETRETCDRGVPDGPASRFSAQIIDKALSFLQDQCSNYIPNSGDCTLPIDSISISTSPSEIYPWNTAQDEIAAKEILPTRVEPPRPTSTLSLLTSTYDSNYLASSQSLGTRVRPASYGRASSWSDAPPTQDTQASVSKTQTSRTSPGVTISTWTVLNTSPEMKKEESVGRRNLDPSSTTWYPAAGSQLNNEVDEPNQLGLRDFGGDNNGSSCGVSIFMLILLLSLLLL